MISAILVVFRFCSKSNKKDRGAKHLCWTYLIILYPKYMMAFICNYLKLVPANLKYDIPFLF